jgi:cytosine/adenosine deaminase-related metal-dependent hydrolase
MSQVHHGHVFHVAGRPSVTGAAAALVSIPDGTLVVGDDGRIAFCGNRSELPDAYREATVHDHGRGFLLPGFVDAHMHFPQTYAGTTAAMVFGSAFPHAQDALFDETLRRLGYGVDSYLDTYDGRFLPGSTVGGKSLLGRRTSMAHAVHCQDAELRRMAETGASIAHCPVSQLFLGSGTLPWRRTVASGVNIAAGTDFGGGDEWLIPRVLGDAFKQHISEPGEDGVSMHPATAHVYVRGRRLDGAA